jgi:hypothetical protein
MSAARRQALPLREGDTPAVPQETVLIDAEEPEPAHPEFMTDAEAEDFARLQAADVDARAADAVATLRLAPVNLQRAHEVRVAFAQTGDDCDAAERLLLELVAGESAIAMELQDVEGGLASLLRKTVINPTLTIALAKALREVVGVNNAIRRRMENSLGAAENLKAQRRFLRAQRGRIGV